MYPNLRNFEVTEQPEQYLSDLQWNDKLAVAISRDHYLSRSENGLNYQNIAYCFDHPNFICGYSLTMLARKDFSFLDELNDFIQRAVEGGLVIN